MLIGRNDASYDLKKIIQKIKTNAHALQHVINITKAEKSNSPNTIAHFTSVRCLDGDTGAVLSHACNPSDDNGAGEPSGCERAPLLSLTHF